MTTDEARRERQLRLLADTEELLATLKRLEYKVDINQQTQVKLASSFQRTKSAVSLSMLAVIASVFLWYGQARAQNDETSIIKCTSTWADLSTRASTARAAANQARIDVEKQRADEISSALKDALDGRSIKVIKREINQADSDYKRAYKKYQDAVKASPIPESPKFSCLVEPFHLTPLEYIIAAIIAGMFILVVMVRAVRSWLQTMKENRSDRGNGNPRARHQEAGQEARESGSTEADAGTPPFGHTRPSPGGREAEWNRLSDGYE